MSEAFLQHIFELFAQERSDARSVYHGTGLGMAIVKELVDQMHGTISVTSREGVGSTFVITLPFEIAEKPAEKAEATIASIRGLHLLLAEDNQLNAKIAQTLFTDKGAQVTLAENGREVVDMFRNHQPGSFDAILMDIMMPELDGLQATQAIRALERPDAKTIPIIAMTANAFAEDAEKCLAAGMNAFLTKPLEIEKAVQTIAQQGGRKEA